MVSLVPFIVGLMSYLAVHFFVNPLFSILNLRKKMHEKINLYANCWQTSDEGLNEYERAYHMDHLNNGRTEYRVLASQGISEYETLQFVFYTPVKLLLEKILRIDLKLASDKFWALEADLARPDASFRKKIVKEIKTALQIPLESKENV